MITLLADCAQQESWQQDAVVMGGLVAIVFLIGLFLLRLAR